MPFPDAYLGALLAKITELATPNFTYLVESIYQELRVHKVKKNSIEAKVREVSEKSKDRVWVVKETIRVGACNKFSLHDIHLHSRPCMDSSDSDDRIY